MKHLDQLLDELQHPVDIVQAWCDEDKDRAVVACISDLYGGNDDVLFDAFCEAYPDHPIEDIRNKIEDVIEEISAGILMNFKPEIDYANLYLPLEHIINDRIEVYNKS